MEPLINKPFNKYTIMKMKIKKIKKLNSEELQMIGKTLFKELIPWIVILYVLVLSGHVINAIYWSHLI